MITSCGCDSFNPADVTRIIFDFVRSSSIVRAPVSPIPLLTPPVSWWISSTEPLYGTMPSIPSGTSFDSEPSVEASTPMDSWK